MASSDRWVGRLYGALIGLDSKQTTHLAVKRGLVLSALYVVPIGHVVRCDDEGVFLDVSTPEVLHLPRLRPPGPPTALTSETRVFLADGTTLKLKGLRVSTEEHSLTRLMVKSPGLVRRTILLPADKVGEPGQRLTTAAVAKTDLEGLPSYRLDRDTENDLWEVLHLSDEIGTLDLKTMTLQVVDSHVSVEGNVRASSSVAEVDRLVRSVDGVEGVTNSVISDWAIELAVASYISREAPSLQGDVVVNTQLGTVFLEGRARSAEAKEAIIQGMRLIQGVRGIEDMVEVG